MATLFFIGTLQVLFALMIGGGMISVTCGCVTALMGGDKAMCAAGIFGGGIAAALGCLLMPLVLR